MAFLRNEPGGEKVAVVLTRSWISAVNLAEMISKMVEYGKPLDDVSYQVERLRIPVIPFDAEQAKIVASLWKCSRVAGLSLGDRACLVLALKTSLPALTTERESKGNAGERAGAGHGQRDRFFRLLPEGVAVEYGPGLEAENREAMDAGERHHERKAMGTSNGYHK